LPKRHKKVTFEPFFRHFWLFSLPILLKNVKLSLKYLAVPDILPIFAASKSHKRHEETILRRRTYIEEAAFFCAKTVRGQ